MATIKEARAALVKALRDSLRENDGSLGESDQAINDASRALVVATRDQHGVAWLGSINHGPQTIWQWDGGLILNFAADFVLPAFDAELERLIVERLGAPYTSTNEDAILVNAILERIQAAGGFSLFWT